MLEGPNTSDLQCCYCSPNLTPRHTHLGRPSALSVALHIASPTHKSSSLSLGISWPFQTSPRLVSLPQASPSFGRLLLDSQCLSMPLKAFPSFFRPLLASPRKEDEKKSGGRKEERRIGGMESLFNRTPNAMYPLVIMLTFGA